MHKTTASAPNYQVALHHLQFPVVFSRCQCTSVGGHQLALRHPGQRCMLAEATFASPAGSTPSGRWRGCRSRHRSRSAAAAARASRPRRSSSRRSRRRGRRRRRISRRSSRPRWQMGRVGSRAQRQRHRWSQGGRQKRMWRPLRTRALPSLWRQPRPRCPPHALRLPAGKQVRRFVSIMVPVSPLSDDVHRAGRNARHFSTALAGTTGVQGGMPDSSSVALCTQQTNTLNTVSRRL